MSPENKNQPSCRIEIPSSHILPLTNQDINTPLQEHSGWLQEFSEDPSGTLIAPGLVDAPVATPSSPTTPQGDANRSTCQLGIFSLFSSCN
jgi:hypothetical protein